MTSNLGTEYVKRGGTLGFLQQKSDDEERESHDKIEKALKGTFRPEFLNRGDEIIMFSPLSIEDMERIVDLQMKEVHDRLGEYNIQVELTHAARTWLAREGMIQPSAPGLCGAPSRSTSRARSQWTCW